MRTSVSIHLRAVRRGLYADVPHIELVYPTRNTRALTQGIVFATEALPFPARCGLDLVGGALTLSLRSHVWCARTYWRPYACGS